MKPSPSCKESMRRCMEQHSFAYAHLYNDEKAMDMHIHDCYEIYYSISGGKQFLIDNCFYDIMDGDIFLINQFESHYLTQIDKQKHERIIISIDPEFLSRLSTETTDLSRCFHFRDTEMPHRMHLTPEEQNRFMYFIHKLPDNSGLGEDILDHALFLELMVFLNRAFEARCRQNASTAAGNTDNADRVSAGAGNSSAGDDSSGRSAVSCGSSHGVSPLPQSGSYHTQVDEILSYIKDGKKVTELGEYIDHFDEDLDKEKLNLLRLYKYPDESQELNMVPQVKENYWLCKCGHYNSLKSRAVRFCPICGTRIEEAREMEQVDNKTLILENINTVIKISPGETREEVIERYVEAFHKKYGFDRDEVRKSIDPEKIKINDQANTVSSTVESAPQSTSDKKWIIIAGVALGVIIFFLLLSSLSETNQKERCYDRGGLWINGACEMFDEGFY